MHDWAGIIGWAIGFTMGAGFVLIMWHLSMKN